MRFTVIIPARLASTRLPGKMLADIHGKPLIQHTYEKAVASGAARVIIATDSLQIKAVCDSFGAEVCMTSEAHTTGTDRIAEAARTFDLIDDEIIINLQGDEPGMLPTIINKLAKILDDDAAVVMGTVGVQIRTMEEIFNSTIVKLILNQQNNAIYFSRAPIPWHRDSFQTQPAILPLSIPYYRHLGIYAFRHQFLQQYVNWQPTQLEQTELLEQLRALYYGTPIRVLISEQMPPQGIDTQQDLDLIRKNFSAL